MKFLILILLFIPITYAQSSKPGGNIVEVEAQDLEETYIIGTRNCSINLPHDDLESLSDFLHILNHEKKSPLRKTIPPLAR